MVQINFAQKQVNAKIVYYGPGMSGKTTNLEVIHQRAPDQNRGELTSISTDGDRTLFFDFMPLDLGTVAGMRTCFQIYTVPGQVYYNSTRKLVLQGVDGVVFVADSSASMVEENLESLRNLEENLNEYGKSLSSIALVIQYNKRDLPDALPVEKLNELLNPNNVTTFEAIASTGQGVFPTLKALAAAVLESIHSGSKGVPQASSAGVPAAPSAALPTRAPEAAAHQTVAVGAAPAAMARTNIQQPPQQAAPQSIPMGGAPIAMGGGAVSQPPRPQAAPAPQAQAASPAGGLSLAGRAPAGELGKTNMRLRSQPAPQAPQRSAPQPQPQRQAAPQRGKRAAPSSLEGTRFRPRASRPEARPTPAKKSSSKVVAGVVIAVALVVGVVLANVAFKLF
jgi:signal recognition particle receptor subunit beta